MDSFLMQISEGLSLFLQFLLLNCKGFSGVFWGGVSGELSGLFGRRFLSGANPSLPNTCSGLVFGKGFLGSK